MSCHRPFRMVAVLFPFVFHACAGEADRGDAWGGVVRDSAGVTVVENPEDGLWRDGEAWTTEEVFRVGGIDAAEESQLAFVAGVDVDEEGRVYVADQQTRRILVFAPDGGFVEAIGGAGEGPGEFGPGIAGVFVAEGRIRVPDVTQQRVNVYTLDGAPLEPLRVDLTGGIPIRWDETPDGTLVAQRRGIQIEGMAALEDGDPVLTVPGDGGEPRLLATLPRGQSFEVRDGVPRVTIFQPEPMWDLGEDGRLAQAMNSEYRVEIREGGVPVRLVTRSVEPVEVTAMEERRILDMTRALMMDRGAPAEAVEPVLRQMEFADHYPLFAQLLLLGDGTLWVQRIRTSRDVQEGEEWSPQDLGSNEWDVFDGEGRYLGIVALPPHFQVLREVGGVLYGVQRDEFDVQSVVGLRLVPPA